MQLDVLVYFLKREQELGLKMIETDLKALNSKARVNLQILPNHFEKYGQARDKSLQLQQTEIVKNLHSEAVLVQVTEGGTEISHQDFVDFIKEVELKSNPHVQFCLTPDVELAQHLKSKFDAHFAFSKLSLATHLTLQILLAELNTIIKK